MSIFTALRQCTVPYICVALLGRLATVSADATLGTIPNFHWKCNGCSDALHRHQVYGHIRSALFKEERSLFHSMDMSWLNEILKPSAHVSVTVVGSADLETLQIPRTTPTVLKSNDDSKEVFEFVVVDSLNETTGWSAEMRAEYEGYVSRFTELPIFPSVDSFLVNNPCWAPISEPYTHANTPANTPAKRVASKANAKPEYRRRLETAESRPQQGRLHHSHSPSGGAGQQGSHGHHHHASSSRSKRAPRQAAAVGRMLILVKLPRKYQLTCQLYTKLTELQNPTNCSYNATEFTALHLANIGYSHTLHAVLHGFANSMTQKKVLIMPQAEDYLSRPVQYYDPAKGANVTHYSGWSWAEPATCPSAVRLHDPWACNFLTLSKCSDRLAAASLEADPLRVWETPTKFMRNSIGVTNELRQRLQDAPGFTEEEWVKARLTAFIERPNVWLRGLLRRSLSLVQPLRASLSVKAHGTEYGQTFYQQLPRDNHVSSENETTPDRLSDGHHAGPCVAMHVRHNDASLEQQRRSTKSNRSFRYHVAKAHNLSVALGAHRIFLATDNASVVEEAEMLYPEYTWYAQRRPMAKKPELFLQFTEPMQFKHARTSGLSQLAGVAKRQQDLFVEVTVGGVQSDLSHILADVRFAGRCAGIVGYFDSALTSVIYRHMCSVSADGDCPASIDLRGPKEF